MSWGTSKGKVKMLIDKIANSSSLKNINPIEKFFLSIVVLIFLLSTTDKLIFILNFLKFSELFNKSSANIVNIKFLQ